jgi:multiple sugar transport system ATP-binding protein
MAYVTLKNIYKFYEKSDVPAVADFNLEIKEKEFIVLVGPSGCGKSTTLRMIAGLEEISYGNLYIDGVRCNDVEPKDRNIAMVFQNYALYPHMTVFKNMAFGLKMSRVKEVKQGKNGKEVVIKRKYTKEEIWDKVLEAARILEIEEYLDRKPRQLSGGQRQRGAIGRAIVRKPKVFLMDEPLSNLDAKLRNQMRSEILLLRKKINTTFVYVTHDQVEAMTLGDRIVVMKDGFIQQIGTPSEVFDHPANLFVAGFIGTPQMNFFDAVIEKIDGKYRVFFENRHLEVRDDVSEHFDKINLGRKEIVLGIRPEHIKIVRENFPKQKGVQYFKANVIVSEMMGSELHLHVKTENNQKLVIRVQTIELSKQDRLNLEKNGSVEFTFDREVMHLFDKEKEVNLVPTKIEEDGRNGRFKSKTLLSER